MNLKLSDVTTNRDDLKAMIGGVFNVARALVGVPAVFISDGPFGNVQTSAVTDVNIFDGQLIVSTRNTTYYFEEAR